MRLAWTALAAASAALLLHRLVAGNLTAVLAGASVALAVLARIGVVVIPPVVGFVVLALLVGLVMCPRRERPPVRYWLASVATGGGGILAIFVVLDWLG